LKIDINMTTDVKSFVFFWFPQKAISSFKMKLAVVEKSVDVWLELQSLRRNRKKTVFLFFMSKPNERSCRFFGIFWKVSPLPYLPDCLQNATTFFLFGLCRVWKSMFDKSIHFVCFPKEFWVYLFPTIFTLLFQKKLCPFCQKLRVLAGNRQTTKNFLNEKFECFRCFFIRWLY